MNTKRVYIMVSIVCVIAITSIAMAGLNRSSNMVSRNSQSRATFVSSNIPSAVSEKVVTEGAGPLTVSGQLVQEKFFSGGEGTVKLWLTLRGDRIELSDDQERQAVDMVVVLDQSGSMEGAKIEYARLAVQDLVERLSDKDRFALFGYDDAVRNYVRLSPVTDANRERFQSIVASIRPNGSTNLGGGLQDGIDTLLRRKEFANRGKLILISDGLANRGVTDVNALGNIASIATEQDFAISTVGVGDDFNEDLMTLIADRGVGNYYYLDNLAAFAEVFEQEFYQSATAVAHGLEISIPLPDGVSLVEASGYPISMQGNRAIVHYGDVGSGQTKRLFLTFQFPTGAGRTYSLQNISLTYAHQGTPHSDSFPGIFQVACVDDRQMAVASIDAVGLALGSYQIDNNIFETRVATELKNGDKDRALALIDEYETQSQVLFDQILADGKMTDEIQQIRDADQQEITEWRTIVEDTFTGSRQEISEKQNYNSKFLQFRSYKQQRSK